MIVAIHLYTTYFTSPIITFIIILLLPSILTFLTLLIHRIRAARAARRERAPEEFVHSLPWRIWTGTGWEKHAPTCAPEDPSEAPSSAPDLERGLSPSGSRDDDTTQPPWVDEQMECAICLEMFVKGDRVRVLPCGHLFHLSEIDEWLISKKKVVSQTCIHFACIHLPISHSARYVKRISHNLDSLHSTTLFPHRRRTMLISKQMSHACHPMRTIHKPRTACPRNVPRCCPHPRSHDDCERDDYGS